MVSKDHFVIGLMSGSSLDGLDIALCKFEVANGQLGYPASWELVAAETIPFPGPWQARLRQAVVLPGRDLWRLHTDFGHYAGRAIADFLSKNKLEAQLVGSHGHTLFHDPDKGSTTQIGDGAAIASRTGLPTVTELRTADMALGGQGAPIAPIADHYLFPDYGAFLNLGGIANICIKTSAGGAPTYSAGDVSAANQIMDRLAKLVDPAYAYDPGGRIAASGQLLPGLTQALESMEYHQLAYPKSLGNAWVVDAVWPIVRDFAGSPQDKLHTFCHFLAGRIHADLHQLATESELSPQPIKVLVSGGGSRNDFLLQCLRGLPQDDAFPLGYAIEADSRIGDFKEAALVALMALLRQLGQTNSFASATGAKADAINGALYLPPPNPIHG